METIEIKDTISIIDAVKKVLKMAEQVNHPVVRKYDGFFIDSKYGYEKNIKLYFAHKEQDSVCIRNANDLFLNRFCFDDVRFVLKYKYNYECYLSSEGTTLSVYWCVNTAK